MCMEPHQKIMFVSFCSLAVIQYICMSTYLLVWLFSEEKALFCTVCCISDTAVSAEQKMGHRSGLFTQISEVAEPDVTDTRLFVAVWELILCCRLERGNRGALKVLRPYVALCGLSTELARASRTVGSTECFRELRKAWFCLQAEQVCC